VHTPESPPHTIGTCDLCFWLVLDLVLVFGGFWACSRSARTFPFHPIANSMLFSVVGDVAVIRVVLVQT
jgi:hypothetical protein